MWTATVKSKELVGGALNVTVDFTDGTRTVTESCIPQDKAGFEFWVKSRLATFNGGVAIDAEYAVDAPVVIAEPVVVPPTQAELDYAEWFNDFNRLVRVQKLIELGIIQASNAKVVALKNKVTTNLKAEYIDSI
jgi:hypothetical protein